MRAVARHAGPAGDEPQKLVQLYRTVCMRPVRSLMLQRIYCLGIGAPFSKAMLFSNGRYALCASL